jgi:hypothetical protein
MSDADWDGLGDRLHEPLPELEEQDVARALLALSSTPVRSPTSRMLARRRVLAAHLLRATRQAWDQRHRPLPVFVLDA